ncbi:CSM3 [[Candida] subhashii]|uniref:Chromosome segregation in meiosis protein n=1 Tax=[Candida] subhashii TaxID=561895 RepID=A0A8J5QDI9_9ASCO|nr:CSM3 [[Candida] subhashii]KAG7661362.1 CSM3 [[Candida] subhashii]
MAFGDRDYPLGGNEDPMTMGTSTTPEDDVLGLDQPLKLKKRIQIARMDNQRIFNSQKGLPYIVKNYPKLIRTIQKNDKTFQQKAVRNTVSRSEKFEHEYNNLLSVLQFYQLWCHGLFPKATFKDCIHLIRGLGSKSPQLRLYRRELIEAELAKLRVEKGIVDPSNEEHHEISATGTALPEGNVTTNDATVQTASTNEEQNQNAGTQGSEDFFGFMQQAAATRGAATTNGSASNGLFVNDDDDDLYHTPPQSPTPAVQTSVAPSSTTTDTVPANPPVTHTQGEESDDPFSDDDEEELLAISGNLTQASQPIPPEEDNYDEENDLDLMREFGA